MRGCLYIVYPNKILHEIYLVSSIDKDKILIINIYTELSAVLLLDAGTFRSVICRQMQRSGTGYLKQFYKNPTDFLRSGCTIFYLISCCQIKY